MSKITGEPTLQGIDDYNTLSGEKKKIFWAVIIAGLIIGSTYVIASKIFTNAEDNLPVQETIKSIPVK